MKNLTVNIDELAFVLHRGSDIKMECYLDLRNGKILNIPTNEKLISQIHGKKIDPNNINYHFFVNQIIGEKSFYLYIPDQLQLRIYNLMCSFVDNLPERTYEETDILWNAIHGNGGYTLFHRILNKNQELLDLFIEFRDNMYEKLALEWLKENEINPVPQGYSSIFN